MQVHGDPRILYPSCQQLTEGRRKAAQKEKLLSDAHWPTAGQPLSAPSRYHRSNHSGTSGPTRATTGPAEKAVMKRREQSIPVALAASQLSLMLALLVLTPMPPVAEPHPTSGTHDSFAQQEFAQPPDCPAQRNFRVLIEGEDEGAKSGGSTIVTLHLAESSADFLHSSERTGGGGGVVSYEGLRLEPRLLPPCFYQGSVEGEDGLAAAKQRNGLISGHFHYAGRVFGIPEQPVAVASAGGLLRAQQRPPSQKATCGVSGAPIDSGAEATNDSRQNPRDRRSLLLDSEADSSSSKKYIQLILIGDQYFYHNQSRNMVKAQDRLWEIANYVNALYKQLGVNVITVYTETWQTDPYRLYSATKPSGANSTELLDLFMIYRMQRLSSRPHSAAHLVSGLKFEGTDVGLAHLGKLCSFDSSGGVNSDRDDNAYGVAVTVAHELGHNLGLEHDKDSCHCPDTQGCIMAAVGGDVDPLQFSSCSVSVYKDFSVPNGLGYCMSEPPADAAAIVGAKVTCGNRIVEPGEECDCGPAKWCKNRCCNPATCRFTAGAACASGECCDQATCRLKPQGTVCRTERNTCDLPEYCNGTSEWCPQLDDYKADGTECLAGQAHCYKGRCGDRDSRCAALFQGDSVKSAPAAWSVTATLGTAQGYCSYTATKLNPLTYAYTACTAANQRCGVLFCVGRHSDKLTGRWKGLPVPQVADTVTGELTILAAYVQHDLKPSGYRDPGLVPNGAECGTNMMCVDSQCVSTAGSASCPSCNGKGSCTRSGLCFCQAGFKPPDCLQAGNGGSLANPMPAGGAGTTTVASASTTGKSAAPSAILGCQVASAAKPLGLGLMATWLIFQ